MNYGKKTERDRVTEIEQDLIFQRFHQEVIKNFNNVDHRIFLDSQRCQRDILHVRYLNIFTLHSHNSLNLLFLDNSNNFIKTYIQNKMLRIFKNPI